jgi:hypothetical protein
MVTRQELFPRTPFRDNDVTCPRKLDQRKCEFSQGIKAERRTEHEAEPIQRGADHRGVEGRGSGSTGSRDQPEARDL